MSDIGFNLIIDDAGHSANEQIKNFEILFPILKPGGIYSIEDVEKFQGNTEILDYFKDLTTYRYFGKGPVFEYP